VFNISNFTRDDNPCCAHARRTTTGFDTWTMIAAYSKVPSRGLRFRIFLAVGAGVLADRLLSPPRLACDRLFAINDAEAHWRGWQITSVHGGFRRRYHDPAFGRKPATAA
jgi:hypothetical protein